VSRTVILSAILAGVLGAFPARLAAATWYEHYAAAEQALDEEQWRLAIEETTKALEKRGDSGIRIRTYGMKFTSYFPYLTLGIAYYELGQLDAALQAFETEERLGAITESQDHLARLHRYRNLALGDREAAQRAQTARIDQIVEDSLSQARRLEAEGRLEEAVTAVGTALSVAPDEVEATTALSRLRQKIAVQQEEERIEQRVSDLVSRGRRLLSEGEAEEAASVFRQAIALRDDAATRALLDEAQSRLRSRLDSEALEQRMEMIETAITEATALEQSGETAAALDRLQSALALDPSNAAAQALEGRLLLARTAADRERQRDETAARLLESAGKALDDGEPREVLTLANRVLAIDAENQRALEYLANAYGLLNRQLLGQRPAQNAPPAVSFIDSRQRLADGTLIEIVRQSEHLLSGIVIDSSPVDLVFLDEEGEHVEGSWRTRTLGDLELTEFHVARELPAGWSTLRVVATDGEGLSSSSEYAVVYRRPFVRSPLFLALSGIAPLLAIALLLIYRSRRYRLLRRRRFNPYVAGSPVLDERLFFGREQLLDRILQTLHNNSLLLHGERRIGKTTLQHQLKRRLEALEDPVFHFHPVYVDLQGTPESRFFATLAEELFEQLESLLGDLEPAAALAGTYEYRDFVQDLRRILRRLREQSEREIRIVLLIDEVDELNSYDPRINQKLRSLFMKSFAENLVAVVSGVSIKREWNREGSPWYNFFEELDVGPFRPEDARRLVTEPVRGIFRIDDDAVERILEITGCRPYRIQKLCMRLVNTMHEKNTRRITLADVTAAGSLSESVS
jgi:tetratricopeptide (TPR) repeat protein